MAGLLTYSVCFQRLPVRLGMDSGLLLKPVKSLQQRELLPNFTAFPIIRFRNHCAANVGRFVGDKQRQCNIFFPVFQQVVYKVHKIIDLKGFAHFNARCPRMLMNEVE